MSDETANGSQSPEPKFAFNVSRKWGKRWNALRREATDLIAAQLAMSEEIEPDEAIEDEKARQRAYNEALHDRMMASSENFRQIEVLSEEQERMVAQVLVDVPREWLVADAPEEIHWSDPESLGEWLLEQRFQDLVNALDKARQANLGN